MAPARLCYFKLWEYGPTALLKSVRSAAASFLGCCLDLGVSESFPKTGIRRQCTEYTNQNMYQLSWTVILASALLIALFLSPSSADTLCDASYYGNPDPFDCLKILLDNHQAGTRGLESRDRRRHLFYTGDLNSRPWDVSQAQWRNKVALARTISIG